MPTSSIQAVVVDLDGTLLNSKHLVSQRNQQAIQGVMELGVSVFLATGKTPYSARGIHKELQLGTPGVYVQGSLAMYADGRVWMERQIESDLAARLFTYAEQAGFPTIVYNREQLLATKQNWFFPNLVAHGEPEPEIVSTIQWNQISVNKLFMVGPEDIDRVQSLRSELESEFGKQIVSFTQSAIPYAIEVLPANTSKGHTVQTMLEGMDIPLKKVMAIGDGENDIEMLQVVGLGIAMQNASPAVKSYADYITTSNDDDGVAAAIERFVLNPQQIESRPK